MRAIDAQGTSGAAIVARFYAQLGDEHGELLFDLVPGLQFWIKDRAGRYIRVSQGLLDNYGFRDRGEIIGRTDHEVMPADLAAQYATDDAAVLAGAVIRGRVELVARPDHTTGWHTTDKIPLRGRGGRIIGSAGITRDLDAAAVEERALGALTAVVAHVRAHFAEPLAKPRLARLMGSSIRTLERRFRAAFGLGVLDYQRKLRMYEARHLLVAGGLPITAIAMRLGYSDHSHFTREFRRAHAEAPLAYRRSRAPRTAL